MPRPRFKKLAATKRERILESAAREFAAQGYESASLNHILDEAGISKGAAYYYFDDKADLFMTTVSHYSQLMMDDFSLQVDSLKRENFWPTVAEQYRQQFHSAIDRPWMFGLFKAATTLSYEQPGSDRLADFSQQMQSMLRGLLLSGQSLGLVRHDLADDLLFALVLSVDEAHDRWLLPQWPEMGIEDIEPAVRRIIDLLQRVLAPK